jgi:hypothetical protein
VSEEIRGMSRLIDEWLYSFEESEPYETKCLELVETETFQNIYAMSKDFLMEAINYDAGEATKKYLHDVRDYYNLNVSINKAAFEMTRLNRFYVFRKTG